MREVTKVPFEIGTVMICSKCGAKFNEPQLAESVKSEMRKVQKEQESHTKVRVIVSGCLGVCYPERQTIAFMPVEGKTEMWTTELKKDEVLSAVKQIVELKLKK